MESSVAPYRDEFKIAAPTASCRPAGFGASRSRCLGCIRLRIQHFLCCTPYLHGTHAETCCWRKSLHDGVRTPFCHCGTVRLSEPAMCRLGGDGGFTMLMGEFATAVKYKLPIKVVVLKNNHYSRIMSEDNALGIPPFGTELQPIDFVRFAEACGGAGGALARPAEGGPGL